MHRGGLYADDPTADYFATEADWQSEVATTGVCGKFVYDGTNNTVRLPKYGNKLWTTPFSKEYTYNVEPVGVDANINGGQASITTFGSRSYIRSKDTIIDSFVSADTWKIALQYNWLEVDSRARNIFSAGLPSTDSSDFQVFQSGFENGNLKLFLGNAYGWNIAPGVNAPSTLNVFSTDEFLFEVEYTGAQYIWKMTNIARGDTTPTVCATIDNSAKVGYYQQPSAPYYLILGNFQYTYPAYGNKIKYNLENSYYTINGETTYLAIGGETPKSSNVYYYIQVKE